VYKENPFDNSGNEANFRELSQRISNLESSVAANILTLNNLEISLMSQSSAMAELEAAMDHANGQTRATLEQLLVTATANYNAINASISSLQFQVNTSVMQLGEIKVRESVVEFLDPCGDSSGYDEILLKMSSGKVIAYFEDNGNRHLTILNPETAYQTTDVQKCKFKVDIDGNLQ
jgi:uncharacterized coiled-coil protein SlyX